MRKCLSAAAAGIVSLSAAPLMAETLPVSGVYPARTSAAVGTEVIAIESFGGDRGSRLAFELSDRLSDIRVAEQRWFRIVPTSGDDVDAVMRGSASTEFRDRRVDPKEKKECVERDEKRKCVRRETRYVDCFEITAVLRPDVRLIAVDGRELYSNRDRIEERKRWCRDEYEPRPEDMLDAMVDTLAAEIRADLAPVQRSSGIRVMESRKDLQKSDRKPFRNAVLLTKSNVGEACKAFGALEPNNPRHVSVLYNIGLCAEGQDDFDKASSYYERALAVEPGKDYPTEGLRRISDRRRAMRQMDEHFAPYREEASADAAGDAPPKE